MNMTINSDSSSGTGPAESAAWKEIVLQYQTPSTWRAVWQIINTLGPLVLTWYLIYVCLSISWWLVIPLAMLSGGFLVRAFIIFHDCGHGSFFKSRAANDIVGFFTGLLTFTPFYQWRWDHAIHHATSGHLDKRGTGDIWTMTVQEYLESSRGKRFAYRLARNPIVLFVIAPVVVLMGKQRFPSPGANKRERDSVHWMNLAILAMAVVLSAIYGIVPYLIIQLIAMAVAGGAGFWLFYVQHQFDGAYWAREGDWDYATAALQGSSFYKLPRILQWFSGNIGYHHIHHLSAKIPNYNLERCHKAHLIFEGVKPITLLSSLQSLKFRLWDEPRKKLIGYSDLKKIRRQHKRQVSQR